MRSYQDIRSEQDKAARKAAREHRFPYAPEDHEFASDNALFESLRSIPFLGDYVPAGWTLNDTITVDASGFGAEDEPALTQRGFIEYVKAHKGSGYGIVTAGQFQVFVGVYTYTGKGKGKRDRTLTESRTGWTP